MKVQELFEAKLFPGNGDIGPSNLSANAYKGNFEVKDNLSNWKKIPKEITGNFESEFKHLKSLKGGPTIVLGEYRVNNNELETLDDIARVIGSGLDVSYNKIKSLKNIHKMIEIIDGDFNLMSNPLSSNVLGLLKIENLTKVWLDNRKLEKIINKYLPMGDLLTCQQELIDTGLEEFAQL